MASISAREILSSENLKQDLHQLNSWGNYCYCEVVKNKEGTGRRITVSPRPCCSRRVRVDAKKKTSRGGRTVDEFINNVKKLQRREISLKHYSVFTNSPLTGFGAGVATTAAVNKQYEHGSQRDGDTDMSSYETKYGDRENNALGSNSEGEPKFDRSENNDSTKSGSALDAVEYDNLWEKITMDKLDFVFSYTLGSIGGGIRISVGISQIWVFNRAHRR
ncbi:hypothetical protein MTR_6g460700 [Medicago truncatula]|uniref:Uncharacterized protein n=1 Tax=Medicago truncatula TaxID=3880 RepID=A0A072UKV0_MEDTR|nr:hypothetical protein MTR_6g460700 [Medicago truncatula]